MLSFTRPNRASAWMNAISKFWSSTCDRIDSPRQERDSVLDRHDLRDESFHRDQRVEQSRQAGSPRTTEVVRLCRR